MVNSITTNMAVTLFGGATTSTTGVDSSLLTAWTKAKAGIGVNTTAATQDPNAPIAPVWTPGISPADSVLMQRALSNKAFFDTNAKLYSDLGATGDYRLTKVSNLNLSLDRDTMRRDYREALRVVREDDLARGRACFLARAGNLRDHVQPPAGQIGRGIHVLKPLVHHGWFNEAASRRNSRALDMNNPLARSNCTQAKAAAPAVRQANTAAKAAATVVRLDVSQYTASMAIAINTRLTIANATARAAPINSRVIRAFSS